MMPLVTVIVVAYGKADTLHECVTAILASRGVDLEVVVVDNGADPNAMRRVAALDRVIIHGPPTNRGFAGGCNAGAAAGRGEVLVLVNPDAFVKPDAILELSRVVEDDRIGIASASVRLEQAPELLNSAGNPVHFSGITWAGSFGEPARHYIRPTDVASASGAALAMRREVWDRFGGFDEAMFAYLEDTELSLRCWQAGLRVRYVPSAVVLHRYEFGRHDLKFYLLERNRALLLLTLLELRTLLILAPALVVVEVAMLAQAVAGGWLGAKLRGWSWLVRHRSHVRRRRAVVRTTRTTSDRAWIGLLVGRIEPANVPVPHGMGALNSVLDAYWRLARRGLRVATPEVAS